MSRRVVIATVACLLCVGVLFWARVIDPARRHSEFCRATKIELKSLAKKRPPGVTRDQWHHVVAWTLNGHANCLTFSPCVAQHDRDHFVTDLRERLRGPVDLQTIDWIWDEFVRLAPSWGPSYSERWRPTHPDKLREFEQSGPTWLGVEVD